MSPVPVTQRQSQITGTHLLHPGLRLVLTVGAWSVCRKSNSAQLVNICSQRNIATKTCDAGGSQSPTIPRRTSVARAGPGRADRHVLARLDFPCRFCRGRRLRAGAGRAGKRDDRERPKRRERSRLERGRQNRCLVEGRPTGTMAGWLEREVAPGADAGSVPIAGALASRASAALPSLLVGIGRLACRTSTRCC